MSELTHSAAGTLPRIESVSLARPFNWLRLGWDDLRAHPGASLAYGLLVSVLGAVMLTIWSHPYFIAASVSGFLLVGPLLTTGLVELSRRRAQGEPVGFDASLSALGRHREALTRFSLGLLAISAVWFGASTIMLIAATGSAAPPVTSMVWSNVVDDLSLQQALSYLGLGGILSAIVFARAVVSVPMIVDRDADAATAVRTSLRVTLADLPAMFIWATLIVLLVAFGFATFLIGMVVVFPLLGHATWHAYCDLVR